MNKLDFLMKCEKCGKDDIVIYSSVITEMIGYFCIKCKQIYMFDKYEKLENYDEDLKRLRHEYSNWP